jgi:Pilus formation protein N terminal region
VVAKIGPHYAFMFVAAIFVAASSVTRAEEAVKTIALRPNFISTFTTDKPFKTILVGNPKIVEATVQDDRTVVLTPQAVGETNIIFLDERNVRITSINVLVDEGVGTSRVKIHNKALVTSFTAYRCWENRCEYVDEVTAKEPAPSPPKQPSGSIWDTIFGTGGSQPSPNPPPQ